MTDRIPRSKSSEEGFTLVELLVVMAMTLVVGSIVVTSFVTSGRTTVAVTNRMDGVNDLTPAMQRLTRDVRAASPIIIDAAGNYANRLGVEFERNGVTYRTVYYVDTATQELYSDRFSVAADGTVTTIGTSDLVTAVSNDLDPLSADFTPVFTYFKADSTPITCTAATAACRDEHLTAAKIGVELRRSIQDQPEIQYRTVIGVRNTRYGT